MGAVANKRNTKLKEDISKVYIEHIISLMNIRCVESLCDIGVSISAQKKLLTMLAVEVEELKSNHKVIVDENYQLDCAKLESSIEITITKRKNVSKLITALELGAPNSFMSFFYGFSNHDCIGWKKLIGRESLPGRRKVPHYSEQEKILSEWEKNSNLHVDDRFFAVCKATGITLDRVWTMFNRKRQVIEHIELDRPRQVAIN